METPTALPRRFTRLAEARARFGDRVDRLGPWLLRADPLADDAVAWIAANPGARADLDRALERGVAAVPHAAAPLRALLDAAEATPVWVDWDVLDRGGELLLRTGVFGGLTLGLCALPFGYSSPGGNKPLAATGRLVERAARRLDETARFVEAICQPGGLRPGQDGFKITLRVRLMHAQVRRLLLQSPTWDSASWGVPINQHDIIATGVLFSSVLIDGLERMGFTFDAPEVEAYMALWRYVTWLMGGALELIPATLAEARQLAALIKATEDLPDDDARALTRALIEGPLRAAETPRQRSVAARHVQFAAGLCYNLLDPVIRDHLGLPEGAWRRVIYPIRAVVLQAELLQRALPGGRSRAVARGRRYWRQNVALATERGGLITYGLPQVLRAT